MKHATVFMVIAVLLFATNLHAQPLSHFGIMGGAAAANQSWKFGSIPEWSTNNRWGFVAVASAELIDLQFASILAQVQYTQKGMTLRIPFTSGSNPAGGGSKTLSPRIDYLSIPLLVQIPISLGLLTPSVFIGPRADFLLSKKGDGLDVTIDKFRGSEFGVTLGLGVLLPSVLSFDIVGEFRYDATLQDSYSTDFLKVRNRSFAILIGVQL